MSDLVGWVCLVNGLAVNGLALGAWLVYTGRVRKADWLHRKSVGVLDVATVDLLLAQVQHDRGTSYWGSGHHSDSLDAAESWLLSLRDHLENQP